MGARLGQHFLRNPYYAHLLAKECIASQDDTILEVGPGTGVLTDELIKTGARVLAIEKDEALAESLKLKYGLKLPRRGLGNYFENEGGKMGLVTGDVRDFNPKEHDLSPGDYIVAANIPYYITGEIIRHFLTTPIHPSRMLLLIQKEVAQRIVSEKETLLSLSVKAFGTPRIVAKVGAGNFSPPPKVDSAIIAIEQISHDHFSKLSEQLFFEVLHAGFASKRKLALSNIANTWPKAKPALTQWFSELSIPLLARPETISLNQWLEISKKMQAFLAKK